MAVLLVTGSISAEAHAQIKTTSGPVEGAVTKDGGVRAYRGLPYAAPPIGENRWRAPQPVSPWTAVRKVDAFGPRCLQGPIFADMIFRDEPSEDCLYLNVWTPATASAGARLPVMFWIHGGGFQAGSASEPRQDGEGLARRGVVAISINYRLGVFGFFAHPELTREASSKASGNYALLDMVAALQWVKANIAAFGGDPGNVTIFGESAGSFAVSALMASPLAQGLFHRAIGESGAFFTTGSGPLATLGLTASEERGAKFAEGLGATTLAELRARPAADILQAALKAQPWFSPTIDGHALREEVAAVFGGGKQSRVPLLAGWNADEIRSSVVLGREKTTAKSFAEQAQKRFGESAGELLKVYPAATDEEAVESAAALAGDAFIGHGTWRWLEAHAATGKSPVYRYSFDRKIPIAPGTKVNGHPATSRDIGARHAGEIEYVFGALDSVPNVTWEKADRALSDQMMSYWVNFAKSGDPNGAGLPAWPRYDAGRQVLHLDETVRAAPEANRGRYEFLDAYAAKQRPR
jgi:para-nitrobenzyl esterase